MRRIVFTMSVLASCGFILTLWSGTALALEENEVKQSIDLMKRKIESDKNYAGQFTCGGNVKTNDDRVLAYYARKKPLKCAVSQSCSSVDKNGNCVGRSCMALHAMNAPLGINANCVGGTCVPDILTLPILCSLNGPVLKYRCEGLSKDIVCDEYHVGDQGIHILPYNCMVRYDASPVAPDEPMGGMDVLPDISPAPMQGGVIHPWIVANIPFFSHPVISERLERMLHPPTVKLIFPEGGASLSPANRFFFGGFFKNPAKWREDSPVEKVLGRKDDALLLAAKYLRSIPILKTKYEPIVVMVPSLSDIFLTQLINEWSSWMDLNRELVESENPDLAGTIEKNIKTMREYKRLHESIRKYRNIFPKYIDELLSYVEDVNKFFREDWAEVNADRLEEWHRTYKSYLADSAEQGMRSKLREIYNAGLRFSSCLGKSCRLDAIPVNSGADPMSVISKISGHIASSNVRGIPALWRDPLDRQKIEVNPFFFYLSHAVLPDLVFDFSKVYSGKPIIVPVLKIEMHHIPVARPGPLYADKGDIEVLASKVKELPEFRFPDFDLDFPELSLPDPSSDLFVIPPPPEPTDWWKFALDDMKNRLTVLNSICSDKPDAFLVREDSLRYPNYGYDKDWNHRNDPVRDAAALRAYSFVYGGSGSGLFPTPPMWPKYAISDAGAAVGRVPPSPCTYCGTRPETTISQHMELDADWNHLQEKIFSAIDEWNAKVKLWSIISSDEIERENKHSGSYYKQMK